MSQNPALQSILDSPLDARTKGFPLDRPPCSVAEAGSQGWNLLAGDLGSPVAILRGDVLAENAAWMRTFLARTGASLCPHGKTTMSPQLFHRQIADGAWGITLATPQEVAIAVSAGVRRIFLANQVLDPGSLRGLRMLREQHPDLDLLLLVDSQEGVARLEEVFEGTRALPVLLESGLPGGRTGCRTQAEALEVARAIHGTPVLRLVGVECFEGIVMTSDPEADRTTLDTWLASLVDLARTCEAEGLFETEEILLSAGGSAYFDLVVKHAESAGLRTPSRVLLRSGCYLSHDAGHYQRLVHLLEGRLPEAWRPAGTLSPALEVWGTVLSRPEAGLAFLDLGKRDVSHDLHLPRPRWHHRVGWDQPREAPADWTIPGLYDQHAKLQIPPEADLQVGDRIGLAISHPCTTFDKWQLVWVLDRNHTAVEALRTFF